jgi:hypothetical protein
LQAKTILAANLQGRDRRSIMNRKLFILGVGAQKAGTTWLHRYLSGDPAVAAGPMKEYHVWNAVYDTGAGAPHDSSFSAANQSFRQRLIRDPELYFDHFAVLLQQCGRQIATDITPAYAALPAHAFDRIRNGFERRGIGVKVVFLMRDPVERMWSAVRMYGRRNRAIPGMDWTGDAEDWLIRYCRSDHAAARSRYDRTIEALRAAFTPDDIYFGLFETLFGPDAIEQLSAFAGIEPRPGFAASRFNEAPERDWLSQRAARQVSAQFQSVIEFCAKELPESRVVWPSSKPFWLKQGSPI